MKSLRKVHRILRSIIGKRRMSALYLTLITSIVTFIGVTVYQNTPSSFRNLIGIVNSYITSYADVSNPAPTGTFASSLIETATIQKISDGDTLTVKIGNESYKPISSSSVNF